MASAFCGITSTVAATSSTYIGILLTLLSASAGIGCVGIARLRQLNSLQQLISRIRLFSLFKVSIVEDCAKLGLRSRVSCLCSQVI